MALLGTILVADDEELARHSLVELLTEEGYQVHEAADGRAALGLLEEYDIDLFLCDIKMPEIDGLSVLRQVSERYPQTMVMLMTAFASVETVIEALRLGAQDYLLKPLLFEDVLHKVQRLIEHKRQAWEIQMLRREVNRHFDFDGMVGRSPAIHDLFEMIKKVAPTTATVLIGGESGVGKEVVARLIHTHSDRKDGVFLPINCSAIPEALLESQLFGHMRGAFTGATHAQEGLFQRARGGTIFLDEISEMAVTLQPKLLRVLEAKEVLPLGATTPVRTDVRILAATNRDLKQEVQEGRFREDLYYRLNVIEISIPPLRERREDIPPLIEHFIRRHNQELKKSYQGVDHQTMKILMSLPWKGNVRELDNALERAMILGSGEWITPGDLPRWEVPDGTPVVPVGDNLKDAVHAYEKTHIETVLQKTDGDKKLAAELLGLSLSSLYRKLDELSQAEEEHDA